MAFIDEYFSDIEQHHLSNAIQGITTGCHSGLTGMLIGGISGYLYGDEIKSTFIKYKNQILGAAQVAGGILTLGVAGTIEWGTFGAGTDVAIALGFIGSDNIEAGISRMLTDKEVTKLGEDVIAWSGLVPKGYEGITYGLVDFALGSKTLFLSKLPSATRNIVSIKYLTPAGQKPSLMRDIKIYIDKLSNNTQKQRHVIIPKATKGLKIPQGLTKKQFTDLSNLLKSRLNHISDDIFIQASRAGGTAKSSSDIDIRVNIDKFDELIKHYFGKLNPSSAKKQQCYMLVKLVKFSR